MDSLFWPSLVEAYRRLASARCSAVCGFCLKGLGVFKALAVVSGLGFRVWGLAGLASLSACSRAKRWASDRVGFRV